MTSFRKPIAITVASARSVAFGSNSATNAGKFPDRDALRRRQRIEADARHDGREPARLPDRERHIAANLKALVAAGGTVVQDVTDVGYGMLVASIKDANGATVGLRQPPNG
ncbi:MAG: hypothetical protein ABSH03_09570 [Candidatus Lustribacter sp.]